MCDHNGTLSGAPEMWFSNLPAMDVDRRNQPIREWTDIAWRLGFKSICFGFPASIIFRNVHGEQGGFVIV